ncbi:MAG: HipA domain-containing protein [Flavobacteriales bacterium]|nr:HipA domain-containing protein [Flavobacteriales bacterium]
MKYQNTLISQSVLKKEDIENYSGVDLNLDGLVAPLKKRDWVELDISVGGDAPKNFLAVYEYVEGGNVRRSNLKTWPKYIAKVGHKWYPIESINEYLFNELGEVLGLRMASSKLAMVQGQLRFLSKYFLLRKQSLVHGAEIFAGYLSDKEFVEEVEQQGLARKFFTFEFAKDAMESMFPNDAQHILEGFVKMLVFDAIIGNNDRHFYNWGVVKDVKGKKTPTFAPIYDSARGLFWNDGETKLANWFNNKSQIDERIHKYADGSRPKIGWDGLDVNHFELIQNLYKNETAYQGVIKSLVDKSNLTRIIEFLDANFTSYFTDRRMELIQRCLRYRFERLNEVIQ